MKRSLSRISAIVIRQYYLLRGSPARLLPLFIWVAVDILLWGFITKYLNTVSHSGVDFVPMLLGAVLFWDFMTRVMQGVSTAFLEDVWSRNFVNLFSSPLTIAEYLLGLVTISVLTSLLGLAVMVGLAGSVFGLSFLVYGSMLVPFLMILFLFGIALGIFGSALVFRFGPAAEWLIWPIPAMISPFAAVFYPLEVLPQWMQYISLLLPPSYVFEGMRAVVQQQAIDTSLLMQAALLVVVEMFLAGWFFVRIYRSAVKSGLLARYSAESAS